LPENDPNGARFYINGALAYSANPTGRNGILDNISILRLGSYSFAVSELYTGHMDNMRIWDRSLAAAEISFLC